MTRRVRATARQTVERHTGAAGAGEARGVALDPTPATQPGGQSEHRLAATLTALIDGSEALPDARRLNFPKDPAAVTAVAAATAAKLEERGLELRRLDRSYLLFRSASWCVKRGAVTSDRITSELGGVLGEVMDEIARDKAWLSGPVSMAAMLRRRRGETSTSARQAAREAVHVADLQPGFTLVELRTRDQIRYEGVAIGHCLARCSAAYAAQVGAGQIRLFSIRAQGKPMVTIEYCAPRQKLVAVQAGGVLNERDLAGGVVREALRAIARIAPLGPWRPDSWFIGKFCDRLRRADRWRAFRVGSTDGTAHVVRRVDSRRVGMAREPRDATMVSRCGSTRPEASDAAGGIMTC